MDLQVFRQVIGFLFLTFVPGAIITQLIGLKGIDKLEVLLLSVGLSIAFLMISGLILNEFASAINLSRPFQPALLMVVLVGFVAVGASLAYLKKDGIPSLSFTIHKRDLLAFSFFGLVVLSVAGAFLVDIYNNNLVLMLLLLLIPLVFAFLMLSAEAKMSRLYVVALFVIALSLLFHYSLISRYIMGFDSQLELLVFRSTETSQRWGINLYGSMSYGRFASMLSITILPTFYSMIMNLDPTWVFKIVYPLFFACVPLCLYQIWQNYFDKKFALIAAFLIMAQLTFYGEMLGLNRQMVAELFFSLLLLVILSRKLQPIVKTGLFLVFSTCLVISHYGLSLIFLFFISATFAYSYVTKKPSKKVTAFAVVSFFVIMFSWYIYTSGSSTFESITEFGQYVLSQAGDFFNPAARGQTVLTGLGLASAPTLWHVISRGFAYATQLLIIIAFLSLIRGKIRSRLSMDYLLFTLIAGLLLAALIIVPGLANTLNMTRFYHILLFFLAPLCVLGAEIVANLISKKRKYLFTCVLILIILIPYFLFQTGFMYEVTRSGNGSYSISISKNRISISDLTRNYTYMDAGSVFGAIWLSQHINQEQTSIYSDEAYRIGALMSYGLIYSGLVNSLWNTTQLQHNDTIFLGTCNTETQWLYPILGVGQFNFSELSFDFSDLNKVYDNGYSQVYQSQ